MDKVVVVEEVVAAAMVVVVDAEMVVRIGTIMAGTGLGRTDGGFN